MVVRCTQPTIVAVTYNCDLQPHNPAPLDQMTSHTRITEEVACSRLQDNKKSEERNAHEKRVGLMGKNTLSLATRYFGYFYSKRHTL